MLNLTLYKQKRERRNEQKDKKIKKKKLQKKDTTAVGNKIFLDGKVEHFLPFVQSLFQNQILQQLKNRTLTHERKKLSSLIMRFLAYPPPEKSQLTAQRLVFHGEWTIKPCLR